jgi:hypothetical protein
VYSLERAREGPRDPRSSPLTRTDALSPSGRSSTWLARSIRYRPFSTREAPGKGLIAPYDSPPIVRSNPPERTKASDTFNTRS